MNIHWQAAIARFELAIRIYVFLMINLYAVGKITGGQFYRHGHLPESVARIPLGEASGFDLAWTFFGFSPAYVLFIGLSQMLGALLLLFERSKLIGVAILTPILLNIIAIDILYGISTGALMSAVTYLTLTLLTAWLNREKIIGAWRMLTSRSAPAGKGVVWSGAVTVALILVAIFWVETGLIGIASH